MTYEAFLSSGSTPPSSSTLVSTKIPATVEHAFPDGYKRPIQVNFCKNHHCANFGVPASLKRYARRAAVPTLLPGTDYTLSGSGKGLPVLVCRLCGESLPMKSNAGISEEIDRMTTYLVGEPAPSCPNASCYNHGITIYECSKGPPIES